MKQCFLAIKDMRDSNGGGEVFGFVTTGSHWRMVQYDGALFEMSEEMTILTLFERMGTDRTTHELRSR
ncbi:hypothetical protein BGX38DRAFT_1334627 [Terfezia claveryi]|nr:hypothetical protein BGX38DRAFT_1334627 [Terfezia claveryi]